MKLFKNMKIRAKLIVGFLITVLLTAAVGTLGVIGLLTLSNNETYLYEGPMQALYYAEELEITLHEQRVSFRDQFINLDDPPNFEKAVTNLARYQQEFDEALESYKGAMGEDSYYTAVKDAYENEYLPILAEYQQAIATKNENKANQLLDEIPAKVGIVQEAIIAMVDNSFNLANKTQADDTNLGNILVIAMAALAVVAAVMGVILAFILARFIAKPTQVLVAAVEKIEDGDLDVDVAEIDSKDEIGILARGFEKMVQAFHEQEKVLTDIADGDYTGEIRIRSDRDAVNKAINLMLDNNNEMINEIRTAAEQVAAGSAQIADGAQALATGSTEQAATLQQFSATMQQVQLQAEENTSLAGTAAKEADESGRLMGESVNYMAEMSVAMQSIDESSQSIAKVIKVIDDIAFQTNILALNAAVEAARAGQHGKGFAVVADEVRNLASKSAAAAKETADLIQNSVETVARGSTIAEKTSQSLTKAGEISASNIDAIQHISEASSQQSNSITEINDGIGQISQVVQANSATAEESAASSEQLSAQSALLSKIVSRFKLRNVAYTPVSLPAHEIGHDAHSFNDMPATGDAIF